jgi:hypothetical protein
MAETLAEKFSLEQCVRYLAVKGGFVAAEHTVEGARERAAVDALRPLSLKEPQRPPSRDHSTTLPRVGLPTNPPPALRLCLVHVLWLQGVLLDLLFHATALAGLRHFACEAHHIMRGLWMHRMGPVLAPGVLPSRSHPPGPQMQVPLPSHLKSPSRPGSCSMLLQCAHGRAPHMMR